MDYTNINKFNKVIEELQFSSHSDIYVRDNMKRYEKSTFVFNLYLFPDLELKPLYLCYINDIKQHDYTDSHWHHSDEIHRAQEKRAEMCTNEDCYCKPFPHHTFEINENKVMRYFEMVVDIGDIVDGTTNKNRTYMKPIIDIQI